MRGGGAGSTSLLKMEVVFFLKVFTHFGCFYLNSSNDIDFEKGGLELYPTVIHITEGLACGRPHGRRRRDRRPPDSCSLRGRFWKGTEERSGRYHGEQKARGRTQGAGDL